MIITNSLIYKPVLQRPATNNSLNFSGFKSRVKPECVLPDELQTRLQQFAQQYSFARKPIQIRLKRAIDIAGATVGLVLTAPIMALSAAAIKLDSKGPAIFRQKRIGLMGKLFDIYKLRSMLDGAEHIPSIKSKDDPRLTRVGKILRRFSIDELPQLFNILKGDMSLIGPRPCILKDDKELWKLDKDSVRRYVVRPGASLNYIHSREGNLAKTIEKERAYLDKWSLTEDVRHFLGICAKIFTGKNY